MLRIGIIVVVGKKTSRRGVMVGVMARRIANGGTVCLLLRDVGGCGVSVHRDQGRRRMRGVAAIVVGIGSCSRSFIRYYHVGFDLVSALVLESVDRAKSINSVRAMIVEVCG